VVRYIYLRQGGCVFVIVCLLAAFPKFFQTDLHEIFKEGWQWANEQMLKFWWRSGSQMRIRIMTLVRHASVEVCTVPVLLLYTEVFLQVDMLLMCKC